jgi:hypothetical protein
MVSYKALKKVLLGAVILLLTTPICFSQKRENFWLKQSLSAGTMLAAGWLHGTNEVAVHDYRRYAARHPNANPQWAAPRVSFRNKYRDYPTDMRAAFWGSKTVLVWTTDAYHLRSTGRNFLIAGNIGVSMSLYEKPKVKQILLQAATSWAFYALGTGAAHAYYKKVD